MSKKICLVSSQYLPHVGGVENYVFNLSRELEKQGHEVTILTSQMEGAPNYEKNGSIEVFRLPTRQFMGGRFPVLKNNKELKEFTKEFKSRHFDLMIINMRFYFLSLWACKLAKKMGVECIIIDHGSSHLNTGGKCSSIGLHFAKSDTVSTLAVRQKHRLNGLNTLALKVMCFSTMRLMLSGFKGILTTLCALSALNLVFPKTQSLSIL